MAQYWTARGTIGKLQIEKQFLQLQLQSLQRHLSVHKLHVKFEQAKLGTDTYHKHLRLLEERRKAVIDSHFASVHGSHAEKYRMLLEEHLKLEDQFRQLAASHVVACYSLQKLIIDVVHLQNEAVLQTVCGSNQLYRSPLYAPDLLFIASRCYTRAFRASFHQLYRSYPSPVSGRFRMSESSAPHAYGRSGIRDRHYSNPHFLPLCGPRTSTPLHTAFPH